MAKRPSVPLSAENVERAESALMLALAIGAPAWSTTTPRIAPDVSARTGIAARAIQMSARRQASAVGLRGFKRGSVVRWMRRDLCRLRFQRWFSRQHTQSSQIAVAYRKAGAIEMFEQ